MRDESIKEIFTAAGVPLVDLGNGRFDLEPEMYAAARALLLAGESLATVDDVPSEQLAGTVDRATKRVSALVDRILRSGAGAGHVVLRDPGEAVTMIVKDIRARAHHQAQQAEGGLHLAAHDLEEVLRAHLQRLIAQTAPVATWLPMVTAPKDRPVLLRRPGRSVGIGHWEQQEHRPNPRPYWADSRPQFGVADDRRTEPTGWMDLPQE